MTFTIGSQCPHTDFGSGDTHICEFWLLRKTHVGLPSRELRRHGRGRPRRKGSTPQRERQRTSGCSGPRGPRRPTASSRMRPRSARRCAFHVARPRPCTCKTLHTHAMHTKESVSPKSTSAVRVARTYKKLLKTVVFKLDVSDRVP